MSRRAALPSLVWLTTVGLLAGAAVVRPAGFEGFGWVVRGLVYPVLMLLAPLAWRLARGRDPMPVTGVVLVMLPFLSDVAASWFDLFRRVRWWDDVSHAGHWFLLTAGLGLLLSASVRPRAVLVPLLGGTGALLAVLWEQLEWLLFYRERGASYEDTLGDLTLGTSAALVAAVLVWLWGPRRTVAGDD